MRVGEYRFEFRGGSLVLGDRPRRAQPACAASIVGTLQDVTAQKLALEERELRLGEVAHDC